MSPPSPPSRSVGRVEHVDLLIVAEDGQAGGVGRYCVDLASVTRGRSVIACLCPAACNAEDCWLAQRCHSRGLDLIQVPMPPRGWRTGLRSLVRVWRARGRPIVHANGRRGNFLSLIARVTVPGFRFATTSHGTLGLHARRNAVWRVVDLAATRLALAVIAVSDHTRSRLLAAGSPAGRTLLIRNGLADEDLAALAAVNAARAGGPAGAGAAAIVRIGYLGRLSPEKGTAELLRLVDATAGRDDLTITIAGDGPDRAQIDDLVRRPDAAHVHVLGAVLDVPAVLAGFDIFVMPSHNEGLPYALLEAMAAGCAVVAFRVGGIPEVVDDPRLGLLVAPGDVDGFVRAVLDLAADPAQQRSIGSAAATHIPAAFALRDRLPLLEAADHRERGDRGDHGLDDSGADVASGAAR